MIMEMKNGLVLIFAGLVFVFGVLKRLNGWYYEVKLGKLWSKLPKGDMGWPLIGSTLNYLKDYTAGRPQNFIQTLQNRYGKADMYKTHILGRASIVICTPELCRQVLTNEEIFIPSLPKNVALLVGRKSLIRIYKAEHRRLRRLITTPISGHAALEMYINDIEHTVINGLEEWASTKATIELLTEIKKLTFKVIWGIFMGSTSSMGDQESGLFYAVAAGFLCLPINFPGFPFRKSFKARKCLMEKLQCIINEKRLVKERKGKSWEAKDMMDLMIEVKDEDGGELDDETIRDLIFGKLFAGHETSAYTAMWAVLFLTDHPHIFQKAKVIDETLRVASITSLLFREATTDVEINGKLIPKGWKVLLWLSELNVNETTFPSPRDFNPSRWDGVKVKSGAFVPFGLGNRLCPGIDLAKLEISIFLHYFLLNYKVERLNPKCERTCIPFPHPKDKCLARVFKVG